MRLEDLAFALSDPVVQKSCFHEVRHSTPWCERVGGLWDVWLGRRWNVLYAHGRDRTTWKGRFRVTCREDEPNWFSLIEPCEDEEACRTPMDELMRDLHRCKKPKEPSE